MLYKDIRLVIIACIEDIDLVIIRRSAISQQCLLKENLGLDKFIMLFSIPYREVRLQPALGKLGQSLQIFFFLAEDNFHLTGAVISFHHKGSRQSIKDFRRNLFATEVSGH